MQIMMNKYIINYNVSRYIFDVSITDKDIIPTMTKRLIIWKTKFEIKDLDKTK